MIRHLLTEAGEKQDAVPWQTYPRPQMVRDNWICLNGLWDFGTDPSFGEQILVPFCPESLLSGIKREIKEESLFYYRRVFSHEGAGSGERVLLHFGAVDQIAEVFLNDVPLGRHEGGYLPFSFDVTGCIRAGENTLTLRVTDSLSHRLPWGKQKKKRGGMWYTPVSGVWQTVWLETVPEKYIGRLEINTDGSRVRIYAEGAEAGRLVVKESGEEYPVSGGCAEFSVKEPRYWTPDNPFLYHFTVIAGKDRVSSYFALRDLSVKTVGGVKRLCLNGEPFFFHGLLDQGYFSDGIYTPASPQGYEQDILAMRALGFNTLRKHIKIEPEQFYYDCDRLGMIVFQDMVNTGDYHYLRDTVLPTLGITALDDRKMNPDPEARDSFLKSMRDTVIRLRNHPSICLWTIFNEGWGQFKSDEAYDAMKALDSSRFIDTASGWFRPRKSDVESRHCYFKKLTMGGSELPQIISEFGGYVYKVKEHSADPDKTYGYRMFEKREDFVSALQKLYREELVPLAEKGLCAAIYTQLSDVEDETNGLITYDRKVLKVKPSEITFAAEKLAAAVKKQQDMI